MPRIGASVLCVVVAGLGCEKLFIPTNQPITPNVVRSLAPAIAADTLIVESMIVERPHGDPYINRELWTYTLPVGTPEIRSLLAENGLRAGILTGIMPPQFQAIITTKAEVVDPHLMTFNNRKETVIPTAGPFEECTFDLREDLAGKAKAITLTQARCGILVRPQALNEGRVKLWCEPQIQHGEQTEHFRPSEDGTKFTRIEETPTEKYFRVGIEVTLGPDDCILIGGMAEEQETLGARIFGAESNGNLRQRLLVIRSRQMNVSGTADLPAITSPSRKLTGGLSGSDK